MTEDKARELDEDYMKQDPMSNDKDSVMCRQRSNMKWFTILNVLDYCVGN